MPKGECISGDLCINPKKERKRFYNNGHGGLTSDCDCCFNFKRSLRFVDYEQGVIKSLDSVAEQNLAEWTLRKRRVKKVLRPDMP